MLTEDQSMPPKRIAVIGGGISGMTAAHLLSKSNHVVLFEAEPRLGGHARTILAGRNGDQPVDTGFIIYNERNYPHLTKLFAELDVPVIQSDVSFGASFQNGELEYATHGLDSFFALRRNLVNPKFLKMIWDIKTFNAGALKAAEGPDISIGDLIAKMGLGDWFRDYYLFPFTGAIWSLPNAQMMNFSAQAMLKFMENHALLEFSRQAPWYTVQGGSIEYVKRLEAKIASQGGDIRLGTAVKSVTRAQEQVEVAPVGGAVETFDEVVFACHSDQALALLADPSEHETKSLASVQFQPNFMVLHSDTNVMPKRQKCWASWVYCENENSTPDKNDVTYWMNTVQSIPKEDPVFVSLNSTQKIRDELIYDTTTFHHPVFDAPALNAQKTISKANGTNRTWFCGAWMKSGFHEDGFSSAYDVATSLQAQSS